MLVNFAKVETGDTAFDNMINGSLDLATKRYSGEKIDEADYAKKNADLLVNIGANITADDKYAAKTFAAVRCIVILMSSSRRSPLRSFRPS
mgnify:CR=1 FL=1